MLLVAIGAFILVVLIYKFVKNDKSCDYLESFPCPAGLPLIGVVHRFFNPLDALDVGKEFYHKYGPNFIVQMGPVRRLVINEPKFLEFILGSMKYIHKGEEYSFLNNWFGDGLLTSTGYKWKSHRKVITPTFHYKILEEFVQIFNKESDILVRQLRKEIAKDSFDIYQYISLCTLDIICETAMGTALNIQENPTNSFYTSVKDMCDLMYCRCFNPLLRVDWIYRLSKYYKREMKALKVLHTFSNDIIESKRKQMQNRHQKYEDKDEFNVRPKTSFLDMLLQCEIDGKPLTHQEVQDEVNTFIFEGHDTTAVAISFALYCLSRNQDIQETVYKEIINIVGADTKRHPTHNELMEMKYLEMVIKETLRLYPSVPAFGRVLLKDAIYDNITLPEGLGIYTCPYLLHRDPKVYPEPEKFVPERFTLERCAERHPYAYIPFSAGPRNCIGQKFAMLEMKSTISKILKHYKLSPTIPEYELKLISKITIQSANGINIHIEER